MTPALKPRASRSFQPKTLTLTFQAVSNLGRDQYSLGRTS